MGPNKNITYAINGLHGGENRWDCILSDDDEETLRKNTLKLDDITVHCDDVKDNCKVVYKLSYERCLRECTKARQDDYDDDFDCW